jgi:hypothetical protein
MSPEETQRYYESGGDLRGGRSHRPTPVGAAPREATGRESVGLGDASTYRQLERWRKRPPAAGGPPPWLRANDNTLSTDTAAILSGVDIPPERWRSVQAEYLRDGSVILHIQPKGNAYQRTVVFPDASSASEVMSLLRNPGKYAESAAEKKRLEATWKARGTPIKVEPPINSPGARKAA